MKSGNAVEMQQKYKAALEEWIATIREEEQLVYASPAVIDVDHWEQAHFKEEKARELAKRAKRDYEEALRKELFDF